jgi:hypothetical protein
MIASLTPISLRSSTPHGHELSVSFTMAFPRIFQGTAAPKTPCSTDCSVCLCWMLTTLWPSALTSLRLLSCSLRLPRGIRLCCSKPASWKTSTSTRQRITLEHVRSFWHDGWRLTGTLRTTASEIEPETAVHRWCGLEMAFLLDYVANTKGSAGASCTIDMILEMSR